MITRFIYCLFLFLFIHGIVKAQNDNHGSYRKIKCPEDTTEQYALYVPENFVPGSNTGLLIFLDPAARGDLPVEMYHSLANEYNIILAGSYNSQNFNGKSSVKSFVAVYNDILKQYSIHPGRIWISGFSGGARAATSIALSYPEISGVIACGAGFASEDEIKKVNLKAYAALVGDRDMNYSELIENSKFLDEKKQRNILLTFTGEHTWPPVDRFGLAIEWLLYDTKDIPGLEKNKGSLFIGSVYTKLDSGFLYAAWMDAQQLGKIPGYKKTADSLLTVITGRKKFAVDREKFIQAIIEEQNCINDFSMAFSLMINKKETTDDYIWTRKARSIAEMKNEKNRYGQMAADRCFDHCIRSCQEYYFKFFQDTDYKMAYNTARILSLFTPQDPGPYYLMARTEASTGDKKHCKKLLEEAVKKGLLFNNRIIQDNALYKVFTKEEIIKIFSQD